jgi:hypothetical protein
VQRWRRMAEPTIADRLSSFSRDVPLAGDRAPDAPCRMLSSGEATTLGALTEANWALLFFGGSAADQRASAEAAHRHLAELRIIRVLRRGGGTGDGDSNLCGSVRVVEDHADGLAEAYRPGQRAAILLRPDGHIAWRSSRMSPDGPIAWCAANSIHLPLPTPLRDTEPKQTWGPR